MGTTQQYQLPYPEPSDPPNVPADIQRLAAATDEALRSLDSRVAAQAVTPVWMYAAGAASSSAGAWAVVPVTITVSKSSPGWSASGGVISVPSKGVYAIDVNTSDNPSKGSVVWTIAVDNEANTGNPIWEVEANARASNGSRIALITSNFRVSTYDARGHNFYVSATRIAVVP